MSNQTRSLYSRAAGEAAIRALSAWVAAGLPPYGSTTEGLRASIFSHTVYVGGTSREVTGAGWFLEQHTEERALDEA